HRRAAHIADGIDAGHVRLAALVRGDEATRIDVDAHLFQANPTGTRLHAHGDEDLVAVDDFGLAADDDADLGAAVRLLLDALGARRLEDGAAVLGDRLLDDLDAVRVDTGQEAGRQLDDRELGAERLVDHAELQPDDAAANDHQVAGDLAQAD